jgi:SAM-dependent methyltransferase
VDLSLELTPRIKFLMELIPERARVLDLGSGRGEIAFFLQKEKNASVLCLERRPEHLDSCREKGLAVTEADMNNLDDPALAWALSQRWDTVIIIDTLIYWQYPAPILYALADRVRQILLTVANEAHILKRLKALAGIMQRWPNTRPRRDQDPILEFDLSWSDNSWTLQGFTQWAAALGYHCELLARRSINAAYRPPGPFPSIFAKSFVFKLTPRDEHPV